MNAHRTYLLHGLALRTDLDLGVPNCDPFDDADVLVELGDSSNVPAEIAHQHLVAGLTHGIGRYGLAEHADGYLLRFFSSCDFEIGPDLSFVRVRLAKHATLELAALFLRGNAIACLLGLRGHATVHASAIEVNGTAVAIVGDTGAGKSATAALMCAAGAKLVSDDVLRVEPSDACVECFSGGDELRLRQSAAWIVRSFPEVDTRPTVDERVALRVSASASKRLPLSAILFLEGESTARSVDLKPLSARDAFVELCTHPRIRWRPRTAPAERQFRTLAAVARAVPAYRVEVPRGSRSAGNELADRLTSGVTAHPG